jgi:hypothetical protein
VIRRWTDPTSNSTARRILAAVSTVVLLLAVGPAAAAEHVAQALENGVGVTRASEDPVSATVQARFGSAVAQAGRLGTLRAIARARNDQGLFAALASVEDAFRIVGPNASSVALVVDLTGSLAGRGDYAADAAFEVAQSGDLFEGEVGVAGGGVGSPGAFQLLRTLQLKPNADFVFSARVFAEATAGQAVATMRRPRLYLAPEFASLYTLVLYLAPEFAGLYTLVRVSGAPGEPGGVPEPSTWALMILGLGMAGAAVRRRRSGTSVIS